MSDKLTIEQIPPLEIPKEGLIIAEDLGGLGTFLLIRKISRKEMEDMFPGEGE